MIKSLCVLVFVLFFAQEAFAYKAYYYDKDGNRVYKTVEQKDIAYYKNRKRRAYIRQPRLNWEITDEMRARNKRTFNYKGKN